jgi:hypothetical protein
MEDANVKKIIVNGEELEIYTSITNEEIEDNSDLFYKKELLEDTIELDNIINEIKNGDNNG